MNNKEELANHFLRDALKTFRSYRSLAEKALAQISDEEFFSILDAESNSIAVIMKHMAGNMFSRWTDFLTADGEKPNRNRDMEFVIEPDANRETIIEHWNRGWDTVFQAIEPLTAEDFAKKVMIRGEEHTIIQAINRQLTHYAYHVGQIVFLAKHYRSREWKSLSIPRNRSQEFNQYLDTKVGRTAHPMDEAAEFASEGDIGQ